MNKNFVQNTFIRLNIFSLFVFLFTSTALSKDVSFSKKQICKAAIATINFKNPKELNIYKIQNNVIYLSYIRTSDQTKWSMKCKTEGNKIIWASIFNTDSQFDIQYRKTNGTAEGRWRESKDDSKITFNLERNKINIMETYEDGSVNEKSFSIDIL